MSSHNNRQPGLRNHSIGGIYPLAISARGTHALFLWDTRTSEVLLQEQHDGTSQGFKETYLHLEEHAESVLTAVGL